MTLAAAEDFTIDTEHGIIRCRPKTPGAASAFKVLQVTVTRALEQLPDAPAVSIDIDGVIGPSLTLAVQVIAQRLAAGKHQGLAQLGGLQPEEAVPAVATHAMEIAGYLDGVMQGDPTALVNPQTQLPEGFDLIGQLKSLFTGKRIAAMAGTLLGAAVFIGLGASIQRRGLGMLDRSGLLPPSDGTDEFDDPGHDDDDDGGPMAGVDTENAIDAEAVEVPPRAA